MQTFQKQAELKSYLLTLGDEESSFALVILRGDLDAHGLVAVRQAERLCDFTIVLALDKCGSGARSILAQAGAHVLYMPEVQEFPVEVNAQARGVNATLVLQSILAVMPMVVTLSPNDIVLHTVLERLHRTFPDAFSLMVEETPAHLMNAEQKKVRTILLAAKSLLQAGESNFDVVREAIQDGSRSQNLPLTHFQILNEDLQPAHLGELPRHGLIHASFDGVLDTIKF